MGVIGMVSGCSGSEFLKTVILWLLLRRRKAREKDDDDKLFWCTNLHVK